MWQKIFALLAPLSSLSPFSPSSPLDAQTVPYATDLKFMRASIDALPSPCYFNAYGSVIVNASSQEILCRGYNRQVSTGDPTEHGEIDAIRTCIAQFTDQGLSPAEISLVWPQSWIYTTAEPCPMCQATILQSGFQRVIYGTSGPTLYKLGWTEYLVSVRSASLSAAARKQPGFGAGRPIAKVVGPVGDDETDGLFGWQFQQGKCPKGCERKQGVCEEK